MTETPAIKGAEAFAELAQAAQRVAAEVGFQLSACGAFGAVLSGDLAAAEGILKGLTGEQRRRIRVAAFALVELGDETMCAHCDEPIERRGRRRRWVHSATGHDVCKPDADASPWAEPLSDLPAVDARPDGLKHIDETEPLAD